MSTNEQRLESTESGGSVENGCVANIGVAERRQRMLIGVVGSVVCAAASILMAYEGVGRAWRLMLFVPWWISMLGVLQARAETCVALAARSQRQLGGAPEALPAALVARVQAQAREVLFRSFVVAAALTALGMLF
jgi:hypothetical protein